MVSSVTIFAILFHFICILKALIIYLKLQEKVQILISLSEFYDTKAYA